MNLTYDFLGVKFGVFHEKFVQAFAVIWRIPLKQRALFNRDNTVIEMGHFNLTNLEPKVFSR
jgi:hypothetical protein